jgi:hypothetical protein
MKSKGSVRIVKKLDELTTVAVKEVHSSRQSRQDARDMAATVNSWVSEFQQRREDESVRMLRTLFPAP